MNSLFSKLTNVIPDPSKFLPGVGTVNEVQGFDIKTLCSESHSGVKNALLQLQTKRNVMRISRIIINNESDYPLIYVNSGSSCGYFFSDASFAFQHKFNNLVNVLNKNEVGGIMHSHVAYQNLYGSCGCIIFVVHMENQNYVVKFGFYNTSLKNTGAGIQIIER